MYVDTDIAGVWFDLFGSEFGMAWHYSDGWVVLHLCIFLTLRTKAFTTPGHALLTR